MTNTRGSPVAPDFEAEANRIVSLGRLCHSSVCWCCQRGTGLCDEAAGLSSVAAAASEPRWPQAITLSENVFGEDDANPRRGVEAVWEKAFSILPLLFFRPFGVFWRAAIELTAAVFGALYLSKRSPLEI